MDSEADIRNSAVEKTFSKLQEADGVEIAKNNVLNTTAIVCRRFPGP